MRIAKIEIIPVDYHIKTPHVGADARTQETFENVIVKLYTDDGIMGIGESPVYYAYLGETREHIMKGLQLIGKAIKGESPFEIAKMHQTIDQFVLGPCTWGAKCAIDIALYDIVGKALGQPVYTLLGGGYRTELETLGHVWYKAPDEVAQDATKLVKRGYKAIEVKCMGVRVSIREDVKRIRAVIEAVDEDIHVVADPNQSWVQPKKVINTLNSEFRGVTNLIIEQPIHYLNLVGMAQIKRSVDIPVVACESAYSPDVIYTIGRMEAADMVSIKLVRMKGIYEAMKAIFIAETAGLGIRLDLMHYSKISDTATGHVAANVKYQFPVGIDAHEWFKENPVESGGVELVNGVAKLSDKPGLGLDLDDEEIERIKSRRSL